MILPSACSVIADAALVATADRQCKSAVASTGTSARRVGGR